MGKEIIKKAAIKCKHCGEMLGEKDRTKAKFDSEILGILWLVIPAGAALFGFFWISEMRLIDNPSHNEYFEQKATSDFSFWS